MLDMCLVHGSHIWAGENIHESCGLSETVQGGRRALYAVQAVPADSCCLVICTPMWTRLQRLGFGRKVIWNYLNRMKLFTGFLEAGITRNLSIGNSKISLVTYKLWGPWQSKLQRGINFSSWLIHEQKKLLVVVTGKTLIFQTVFQSFRYSIAFVNLDQAHRANDFFVCCYDWKGRSFPDDANRKSSDSDKP